MNKIQKLSFREVYDFLDYLEGKERTITGELRRIIFASIPDVTEKLAYNVPFYYRHKRICYIWPASVPWGGLKENEGVALGFCQGARMTHDGYLTTGSRKNVAVKVFKSLKDIDDMLLSDLLDEACALDADMA
jgi:hypothetical protein